MHHAGGGGQIQFKFPSGTTRSAYQHVNIESPKHSNTQSWMKSKSAIQFFPSRPTVQISTKKLVWTLGPINPLNTSWASQSMPGSETFPLLGLRELDISQQGKIGKQSPTVAHSRRMRKTGPSLDSQSSGRRTSKSKKFELDAQA